MTFVFRKQKKGPPLIRVFLIFARHFIGQHFEGLSSNQASKPTVQTTEGTDLSVRSSTDPNQPTADDERRMQEILSKPEIREVLMDPQIQSLIDALRHNPHEAQRLARSWFYSYCLLFVFRSLLCSFLVAGI